MIALTMLGVASPPENDIAFFFLFEVCFSYLFKSNLDSFFLMEGEMEWKVWCYLNPNSFNQ